MSMYIYGRNTVIERISNNNDIEELYIQEGLKDSKVLGAIEGLSFKTVSKTKLENLCSSKYHQGIVAKIKTYDYVSLQEVINNANNDTYPTIVMLDGIEDPHNIGAIMRTCEALGITSLIVPKHNTAPLTSTVAKVSTGAIEYMKVACVTNLNNAVNTLKKEGYWIVGAEANSTLDYREVDYKCKICLIIGSEGKGISKLLFSNCDFKVSLPMKGHVNSLNASNASAIMMYQIYNNRYPIK